MPEVTDMLNGLAGTPGTSRALAVIARAADVAAPGRDIWLVGGGVRDAIAGFPPGGDLDIVVEGDVGPLAGAIADELGSVVEAHVEFGTATIPGSGAHAVAGASWHASRDPAAVPAIDVARARTESYASPGALPTVTPATLEDDLARRDFTVNAMALCIHGNRAGELLDPHGGQADVRDGLLRVLHPASFLDDPTRLLRGVRYRAQLGYRWAVETGELAAAAIAGDALDTVSADRIRAELETWFGAGAPDALEMADRLGLGRLLTAGADVDGGRLMASITALANGCTSAAPLGTGPAGEWSADDWWVLVLSHLESADRDAVVRTYSLPERLGRHAARIAAAIDATVAWRRERASLTSPPARRDLADLAAAIGSTDAWVVGLAAEVAAGTGAAAPLDLLAELLATATPAVDGEDVLTAGVPEGPRVRMILDEIRMGVLRGELGTRDQQLARIRELAMADPG